ncbi:hypothetical protein K6V18_22875 [Ralstonia insidiosa]|nr:MULTISPECIES: hypothetical protein [Ralstonia]MBY4707882.1 hypothetical protein [Ralstonia insidiosa]GAQ28429.1 hypothetical protein SAMD00023378_2112 [Ralstonia sp. NT80]
MKKTVYLWVAMGGMFVGSAQAQEIFLQGGTQGAGIGAAVSFNSRLGAHVDVNAINLSHNFSFGGNRYQDDIRLRQGGVYADVFPLRDSGFRTTAGARFSDDELSGTSVPTNGTYTFAGRKVRALPGMYAVAKARYPTVMPYFGIGYGHQPASKGFGFIADLGVAYGIPKSSYTLSPQLAAKVGPVNSQLIATNGLQELRSEMSRYRWYPVIQVGVSYRF